MATPESTSERPSSGPQAGAIAGGVIGGVALIAIIIGIWFFRGRAARIGTIQGTVTDENIMPSELGMLKGHVEKAADSEILELQTRENPVELSSRPSCTTTNERGPLISELP